MNRTWMVGATFLVVLCATGTGRAENRFSINPMCLPAGATGQQIEVRCENDITIYGFSLGINYDERVLTVTSATNAGTMAANADFFEGRIDPDQGILGWGCVWALDGDFSMKQLPPGPDQLIAILTVDACALNLNPAPPVANCPADPMACPCVPATSNTTTQLIFEAVRTNPAIDLPVINVMTTTQGFSVEPMLQHGTISIEVPPVPPVITGFQNNMGMAGAQFTIEGQNLNQPGLVVRVCDVVAQHAAPAADGSSVVVTAPQCASTGCVAVEVCVPGACMAPASCASVADGFCYLPPLGRFRRGDANDDSKADISDAVFILSFLFLPTGETPTCLETADVDDDGAFVITDPINLLQFLFLMGDPPPAPGHLSCGIDPPGSMSDSGCLAYTTCTTN